MKWRLMLSLVASLFFMSCATLSYRPVLYHNSKYKSVGQAGADAAIDECLVRAEVALKKSNSRRLGQNMKRGAVAGAVIGGLAGALGGNASDAAVGLIGGVAVGAGGAAVDEATKDRLSIDSTKAVFISQCLREQGFQVIGWE